MFDSEDHPRAGRKTVVVLPRCSFVPQLLTTHSLWGHAFPFGVRCLLCTRPLAFELTMVVPQRGQTCSCCTRTAWPFCTRNWCPQALRCSILPLYTWLLTAPLQNGHVYTNSFSWVSLCVPHAASLGGAGGGGVGMVTVASFAISVSALRLSMSAAISSFTAAITGASRSAFKAARRRAKRFRVAQAYASKSLCKLQPSHTWVPF